MDLRPNLKGCIRRRDRNRLILRHLSLVKSIAQSLSRRLPAKLQLDDLCSTGVVGLIEAARRFQPRPGVDRDTQFRAFAQRRIRGAMLDSARRGQWQNLVAPSIESLPEPALAADVESTHLNCDLGRLVIGLTDEESTVLRLRHWQDLNLRQAALRMGVSAKRAKHLQWRALRKLRLAAGTDFRQSGDYTSGVSKKGTETPQARVVALLVDELGALREEIATREKREAEIIKQIRTQADRDTGEGDPIVYEGRMYSAIVSAHGSRQKISDKPKVFEILGRDVFFEHCTFSVEKAEKLLTEEQFNTVVTVDEFCSPRKVDSARRAAIAPQKSKTQKKAA